MKNIVLSSVVTALLVFSGCSDKEPMVEEQVVAKEQAKTEVVQEVKAVETETVSADQSVVSSTSSNSSSSTESMDDLEAHLGSIYFGFDEFTIKNKMQDVVSANSKLSKDLVSKYSIKLEGNCDEWGSDEYNVALGLKRANAVKKALVAQGVASSSITMVSFGENNPACLDQSQRCWAKNRRVDFTLLP